MVDVKVFELADLFVDDANQSEGLGLTDTAKAAFTSELAQLIQSTIESYLQYDPRFAAVRESAQSAAR